MFSHFIFNFKTNFKIDKQFYRLIKYVFHLENNKQLKDIIIENH